MKKIKFTDPVGRRTRKTMKWSDYYSLSTPEGIALCKEKLQELRELLERSKEQEEKK